MTRQTFCQVGSTVLLVAGLTLALSSPAAAGGKFRGKSRGYRSNQVGNMHYMYEPLLRNLPAGTVVKSRIDRVEVYLGRALIERRAKAKLAAGNHRLIFPAMPWNLDASTLSIAGFGDQAVAGSTFLEQGTLVEARPKELRELEKKLRSLERRERKMATQAKILGSEREILLKVLSGSPADKLDTVRASLTFARAELKRIAGKLSVLDSKRKALAPDLTKFREIHGKLLKKLSRPVRHVVVEVRAKKACNLDLVVRYVVNGPRWTPRHEARYDPKTRTLRLSTYAWVVQQTGEAWDSVAIRVGNARPTTGLLPPVPRERRIALEAAGTRVAGVSHRLREVASYASGRTTATVRIFTPAGRVTVPSGTQGRRIQVASVQMQAQAKHLAVPMEHPGAYLQLTLRNGGSDALLSGEAALFNGRDYVGTARLPAVLPGEALTLPFGRDPGVLVERERTGRNHKVAGRRQKLLLTYKFSVSNRLQHAVDMEVREVMPRSWRQGLVRVKMVPGTLQPKKGGRKDPAGMLRWTVKVLSGGERSWTWGFEVSAPSGKRIVGVD